MTQSPESDGFRTEQAKQLTDALEIVRSYGESCPEEWVGLRFENGPPLRIVALFSGEDLQKHETALHRLGVRPDWLEVRWSPAPISRLEEVRAEVHQMAITDQSGAFRGWGIGEGHVSIRLKASQEALATEFQERYGDAVDLTVGYFHFPDLEFLAPDGTPGPLPIPQRPEVLPSKIDVSVEEDLNVHSGDDLTSWVRVRNRRSDDVVVLTNGRVTAHIVDPATNEVVGAFDGAQRMPLVTFQIPPDDSVEIPLLIGTASTVPRLGYAVPPGRWAIEALLNLQLQHRETFRTQPFPIIVE